MKQKKARGPRPPGFEALLFPNNPVFGKRTPLDAAPGESVSFPRSDVQVGDEAVMIPGSTSAAERSDWSQTSGRPHHRRWRDKFREAFRGVKLGVRGQSSFFVHFFFAAAAITTAVVLECRLLEWCLLILCIGGVLAAELFNSAIEALFHGLDPATKSRWNGCLDIASGAVLVASAAAFVVGAIIFIHRFGVLLNWWKD